MALYRRSQSGGRRLLIVSYHRVVEDFTGELQRSIPGLLISQETFRRHLEEACPRPATSSPARRGAGRDGRARAARRRTLCVVTFDDGYRDVYRYGYPVLKQMGVPATIYLPAALIGTTRRFNHDRLFHLLRLAQARDHRAVFDVLPAPARGAAGHGRVRPPSGCPRRSTTSSASTPPPAAGDDRRAGAAARRRPGAAARAGRHDGLGRGAPDGEGRLRVRRAHPGPHRAHARAHRRGGARGARVARRIIERELGHPVRDFAYCNGWYSDEVIRCWRRRVPLGRHHRGLPNCIGGDPFTLKRKVLWENFSIGMSGDYSLSLTGVPARRLLRRARRARARVRPASAAHAPRRLRDASDSPTGWPGDGKPDTAVPAAAASPVTPATPAASFLGKAGPLVLARLFTAGLTLSIPLVLARVLTLAEYGTY